MPSIAGQKVHDIISQLPLKWMWKANISTGIGFSTKAVWSRASRRHSRHEDFEGDNNDTSKMAFGFKVRVETLAGDQSVSNITVRWLKGHESVIYESFCGMLKRMLET
jgi:23S rRNA (adenine1618-N6)-methyltransferase